MTQQTTQSKAIEKAILKGRATRDTFGVKRRNELWKLLATSRKEVAIQAAELKKYYDSGTKWAGLRIEVLQETEKQIDVLMGELTANMAIGIQPHIAGSLSLGIDSTIGIMKAGKEVDFLALTKAGTEVVAEATFASIPVETVAALSNYELQLVGSVTNDLASDIKKQINLGIIQGDDIDTITKRIGTVVKDEDAFRKAGSTTYKKAQTRAEAIARTETNRAYTEGSVQSYENFGVQEYIWNTVLDDRTADEDASLDQQVFKMGDGPTPPLHPNCRCNISPYLPSRKRTDYLELLNV